MPNTRNQKLAHLKEVWPVKDQITEFRGKLQLKERDQKTIIESQRQEVLQNEDEIVNSRRSNEVNRVLLANAVIGDNQMLYNILHNRRGGMLDIQKKTAPEALNHMKTKCLDKVNTLNLLTYERKKKEERLLQLQDDLQTNQALIDATKRDDPNAQEARRLENALDKADLKYNMAMNITKHYEQIKSRLMEETVLYPGKLDCVEQALMERSKELEQLRKTNHVAQEIRQVAKKELYECEESAFMNKRNREGQLNATRKEVERRKENVKKFEGKSKMQSIQLSDCVDDRPLISESKESQQKMKITTLEHAFTVIKRATTVTDVKDAIDRVTNQNQTKEILTSQRNERQRLCNDLAEEKSKLMLEYEDMKYSGEKKLSNGQKLLDEAQGRLKFCEDKDLEINKEIQTNGDILVAIKTGVANLHEKLNRVKLRPLGRNYATFDVVNDMAICVEKIETLMKELDIENEADLAERLKTSSYYDYLENKLSRTNVRVGMEKTSDVEDEVFYIGGGQENEEFVSRDDVKKKANQVLDAHTFKPGKKHKPHRKKIGVNRQTR